MWSGAPAAFTAAYDHSRNLGRSEEQALGAGLAAVKVHAPFNVLSEEDLAFVASVFSVIRKPDVVGMMLQRIDEGKVPVSTLQNREGLLLLVENFRTGPLRRTSSEGLTPTPLAGRVLYLSAMVVAWFGTRQVAGASYASEWERIVAYLGVLALTIAIVAVGRWTRGGVGRVQSERDQAAMGVVEAVLRGAEAEAYSLYLRPFAVTGVLEVDVSDRWDEKVELESVLAEALWPLGPVVALGQPGEHLGAGRIAVDEEEWRQAVEKLMRQAQRILLIPSNRPGTLWEIQRILDLELLSRTIFVMPPTERWATTWATARREVADLEHEPGGASRTTRRAPDGRAAALAPAPRRSLVEDSSMPATSVERLADHFVAYLFDEYAGSRHVRRVASWVGFVLKAIDGIADGSVRQNRKRQVVFDFAGRHFKARYNHKAGARGGIEIVEFAKGQGSPDVAVAVQVASLNDAEEVYRNLRVLLEEYLDVEHAAPQGG
jgi:hypothetical protein